MEILRFEEAPTSAPKRKKSSRSFIALGFVATLFGVSTAFASSTITINSDVPIALGQGVSVFTTCDKFIGVNPVTALDTDLSKFKLTEVTIGTDFVATPPTADNYNISADCNGTNFVVKFYQSPSTTPVNICTDTYKVTVPTAGTDYVCTSSGIYFKVSTTRHPILFGESIAPDFFDHISIETTSNVDYTP
jgi:hypothetical protein